MKYFLTTISLFFLCNISIVFSQERSYSAYPVKVLEYRPAPGQFINENYPKYETGDTQAIMNAKALQCLQKNGASGFVTLGAFGGYITLAFDHPIVNSHGDYDFKVYGNAFLGSFEPGIVMVSRDINGNGIPDDPWYELKGSEYQKCKHHYQITYSRPNPLNGDVPWIDNQGNSGFIKRNTFHTQESYYPLWITDETLTFEGTLFPDSLLDKPNQQGYTDNYSNDSDLCNFKIDWAIDAEGNPVHLSFIDFIKVYTAVNKYETSCGEFSTELAYPGIEDLHPNLTPIANIEANTLDPYKDYHILNMEALSLHANSVWEKTLFYDASLDLESNGVNEFAFEQPPYIFNYATLYKGAAWEGFTYSNIHGNINTGYDNQFSAITDGGVEGIGKAYITTYYSSYSTINKQYFEFAEGKEYAVAGCYVTNSVLNYYSMLHGNASSKKFGGETGNDPDWLKVTFTGINSAGQATGNVDFYLADFRTDNPDNDYIVGKWCWVDLSSLGRVTKIAYSMSGSDIGEYGLNTPAYFCLDKIAVEKEETSSAYLSWIKIDGKMLEEFELGRVRYTVGAVSGSAPVVTAEAADLHHSVSITQAASVPGMSSILVTPQEGASKTYTITFEASSAIDEEPYSTIFIAYPNPFSDYLKIEGIANNFDIEMFSLEGRMVFQSKNNSGIINTSNWEKGFYIMKIYDGKSTKVIKVIKK